MHRDLPFGVDLSWYVSVMKVQELIHEQMLILTESHKIKEKNSFSIFTSLERTTLLLYQPTYFLTLIIPLASLWGPSSWSTTSLRLCAYFIEKDCYFCISLKLFPIFFFVTTWNWWLIFSFSVLHLWCLTETLAANRSPVFLWFSLFAVADPYPDPATWLLMTDPNVSGDMIKWEQNGVWIYDSLLKEKWWTDKLFSCQTWDLRLLKLANITE